MKIAEVLNESAHDDWDDEEEVASNPDDDHLVMQLKKAADVGGNHPITFKDGKKFKIPMHILIAFMRKYNDLKPMDRELLQDLASKSKEDFLKALQSFERPAAPRSIY